MRFPKNCDVPVLSQIIGINQSCPNKYIDSRLCPAVSNITIQIAEVRNFLFGASEVANPLVAHSGYEIDSRVLKMLVSGFGRDHGQEEVKSRCEFIESIPDD